MTDSLTPHTGRIFISYRRADSAGYAGRIYDRLAAHFGKESIFMDVDTIQAGLDFVDVLENAVQSCDVLVAFIGRQWLNITDEDGNRRLDNPQDFVRIEVAAALSRGIRVIPVLVDGTSMPDSDQLPNDLELLARRNAVPVTHQSFHNDANRLIEQLELALKAAEASKILKATTKTLDTDSLRSNNEYNFLSQTAMQANKDRTNLSSIYWAAAVIPTIILTIFFTQLFEPDIFSGAVKLGFSGFFILLTLYGTSTIIKLGQLRRTWEESMLAMNQLRGLNASPASTMKKNTSDNHAVEVAALSGLMFGIAIYFLQSIFFIINLIAWLVCLFFGSIIFLVHMRIYKHQMK